MTIETLPDITLHLSETPPGSTRLKLVVIQHDRVGSVFLTDEERFVFLQWITGIIKRTDSKDRK